LVVDLNDSSEPRLILLNKSCRLCLLCETLVVHRADLERVLVTTGVSTVNEPDYIVLGTIDRRTWRRGVVGDARVADIRAHMADFKKYLKVEVTRAHREPSNLNAG
jgi:hypothetical protein